MDTATAIPKWLVDAERDLWGKVALRRVWSHDAALLSACDAVPLALPRRYSVDTALTNRSKRFAQRWDQLRKHIQDDQDGCGGDGSLLRSFKASHGERPGKAQKHSDLQKDDQCELDRVRAR